RLCKRATDLDPDYPFAWLLLAWTFLSDAAFGHGEQRAEAFKRAVEAAKQGIGPGRTVPEYHSLLAFIYLFHGQHDQALAEAERGVALGPSSYNSQTILGYILMFLGRFEEAIDCFNQVRRLSPYASTEWWQTHLGEALGQTGRHEEAVAVYEELIADLERRRRRSRRLVAPHLGLAANYVWLGQEEKARRHAGEVLKLNPKFRLDNLRKWSFYKDETHLERILEALRRAGLK
ncbi:MAG: tetratricopeptide repeat protein, partial [Proteobacteria bacterium]|nr:tetratricopeptide repeat protein [Pseudomonadota bacterium]